MSAEMGLRLRWRVWLAGLVDRNHTELIPLALAEAGHTRLQLVYRCRTVLVVCDESVEPAAEFVFFLNDVVCDRTSAVVLGFVPAQGHGFVVKVNNLGLTRRAWRS